MCSFQLLISLLEPYGCLPSTFEHKSVIEFIKRSMLDDLLYLNSDYIRVIFLSRNWFYFQSVLSCDRTLDDTTSASKNVQVSNRAQRWRTMLKTCTFGSHYLISECLYSERERYCCLARCGYRAGSV